MKSPANKISQVGRINAIKVEKEVILLLVSITMDYQEKKRIIFYIIPLPFSAAIDWLLFAWAMHTQQLPSEEKCQNAIYNRPLRYSGCNNINATGGVTCEFSVQYKEERTTELRERNVRS